MKNTIKRSKSNVEYIYTYAAFIICLSQNILNHRTENFGFIYRNEENCSLDSNALHQTIYRQK